MSLVYDASNALVLYCLVIVLASTAGGHLPTLIRMTHLRTQLLISFVGGLMLGISLLHLLPHAVVTLDSPSTAGIACLLGIVGMFLLLLRVPSAARAGFVEAVMPDRPAEVLEVREATWAASGNVDGGKDGGGDDGDPPHASGDVSVHGPVGSDHQVGHQHGDAHDQSGNCGHDHTSSSRGLSWIGILLGLWLHTMIDGVALAASVVADASIRGSLWQGWGRFWRSPCTSRLMLSRSLPRCVRAVGQRCTRESSTSCLPSPVQLVPCFSISG